MEQQQAVPSINLPTTVQAIRAKGVRVDATQEAPAQQHLGYGGKTVASHLSPGECTGTLECPLTSTSCNVASSRRLSDGNMNACRQQQVPHQRCMTGCGSGCGSKSSALIAVGNIDGIPMLYPMLLVTHCCL